MTYKFFKTAIFSISALAMIVISSCTKPLPGRTDFTTVNQEFVILQQSGFANFASTAFNRGSDTIRLNVIVELASSANPSASTTVNIKFDPAAIAIYNTASPLPGYIPFPAANFKLLSTTLTIPAGQHYAQTTLEVYTKGLDPALSYMAPISIVDASGKNLSGNLNTAYFHTIGNPLAGIYQWLGQRWNSSTGLDTTKPPARTPRDQSQAISPLGPTTLFFPVTYLDQNSVNAGIQLTFDNNAGVLSNFQASLYDPTNNIGAVGFSVLTAPILVGFKIVGDGSTRYVGSTFRFYSVYDNGGGGQRAVIDNFVKQ